MIDDTLDTLFMTQPLCFKAVDSEFSLDEYLSTLSTLHLMAQIQQLNSDICWLVNQLDPQQLFKILELTELLEQKIENSINLDSSLSLEPKQLDHVIHAHAMLTMTLIRLSHRIYARFSALKLKWFKSKPRHAFAQVLAHINVYCLKQCIRLFTALQYSHIKTPVYFWFYIHQLYVQSRAANIHQQPISVAEQTAITIQELYLQLILNQLLLDKTLSSAQKNDIFNCVPSWIAYLDWYTQIVDQRQISTACLWYIDDKRDIAVQYLSTDLKASLAQINSALLLDLSALDHHLNKALTRQNHQLTDQEQKHFNPSLKLHAIAKLNPISTSTVLMKKESQIQLCFGLKQAYLQFLQQQAPFEYKALINYQPNQLKIEQWDWHYRQLKQRQQLQRIASKRLPLENGVLLSIDQQNAQLKLTKRYNHWADDQLIIFRERFTENWHLGKIMQRENINRNQVQLQLSKIADMGFSCNIALQQQSNSRLALESLAFYIGLLLYDQSSQKLSIMIPAKLTTNLSQQQTAVIRVKQQLFFVKIISNERNSSDQLNYQIELLEPSQKPILNRLIQIHSTHRHSKKLWCISK